MIFAMVCVAFLTLLVVGEAIEYGGNWIFWLSLGVVEIIMTYFIFKPI